MSGNDGWGSGLWRQAQKVRVTRNDGIQAPVRANGKDGIRVGDPGFDLRRTQRQGKGEKKPGLLGRLKLLIARG